MEDRHPGPVPSPDRMRTDWAARTHNILSTLPETHVWPAKTDREKVEPAIKPDRKVEFEERVEEKNEDPFLPAAAAFVILFNVCKTQEETEGQQLAQADHQQIWRCFKKIPSLMSFVCSILQKVFAVQ